MSHTFESSPGALVNRLLAAAIEPSLSRPARSNEFVDGARASLLQQFIGKPFACPYKEGTASADAFFAGADTGHRIHAEHYAEGRQLDHATEILGAVNAAAGKSADVWPFVFVGYLIGGMKQIGRHDVVSALRSMAGLQSTPLQVALADNAPTHRLEIRLAASGQWAGRIFDAEGEEVAGVAGCASEDEVEQGAYDAGYSSLDVVKV